jgi:hypothetical protein
VDSVYSVGQSKKLLPTEYTESTESRRNISRLNAEGTAEKARDGALYGLVYSPCLNVGGETQALTDISTESAMTALPDALAAWLDSSAAVPKSLPSLLSAKWSCEFEINL